ncbi:methionine ABC transporter ATP-binding protein [Coxiella burnetii]|uniref:Methionine import ATP-binding protein MetN n=2 Tax=Coxiella burnetii TaxID=777 RepID=METN_COXBU|nr:methionine ABC transporter ATP-binding protein [Coxiella burnetii]NP_819157.1 methionine ABC transporter ATP-binding protein [Coxiella burnetii RSA 493]Q83F44.1 RecName: Full=Methionine import ATP-binding protein MetN [Coxiella burnetii RSA 493]AAO89671.1 methionine transport ATP-binding protein [Coxiella burnetii RSA 493]ABS76510.1 methionine transport ATP-binding protein [Coxiella burnetii Dugway 5J108-111]ACJ19154.1 methionine transport ATP-binding protein [Coxiella burnetii CbuG_Q212]A
MIELRNVTKTYSAKQGGVLALSDINLRVSAGEMFGVIGKSGAGKSTLIRCVNLLERPDKGSVIVDGQVLTTLSSKVLRQARHRMGMVFQHFNLLSARTAYQNIAFPLQLLGKNPTEIRKVVLPLLELTDLTAKINAYPSQLSGGQKQRVAIARALVTNPTVLLCDEMTSALDPETTHSILQLLKNINRELNLSILLITHEMEVIKTVADRVAVLDQGRIVEENDVVSLFKRPKTEIAKKFTHSSIKVKLPEILRNRLQKTTLDEGYALLRIDFTEHTAETPIIDEFIRKFDLQVNILQARLEFLRDDSIGMMLVALRNVKDTLPQGIAYLNEKGLQVEVLGYVSADDWRYR